MRLSVSFQFSRNEKIPVGVLSDFGRDMVFEYDPSFLGRGLNPAEADLNRLAQEVGLVRENRA